MINPDLYQEITQLADLLRAKFSPTEFIPGCLVMSVADKSQYATNNGWIEAVCGQHNQQRVRWKSNETVAVNDYVDVLYFPDRRLFEAYGLGGAGAIAGAAGGNVWPLAGQNLLEGANYATATLLIAAMTGGDIGYLGSRSSSEAVTANEAGITLRGVGASATIFTTTFTVTDPTTLQDIQAEHSGAANTIGFNISDSTTLIDCIGIADSTGTTARGLNVTGSAQVTVKGGYYEGQNGTAFDIFADTGTTIILDGPVLFSGLLGGSGDISGWYLDTLGAAYFVHRTGSATEDITFSNGNLTFGSLTGMSGGVWLLRTDGLRIKQATLTAAIAAAAAGDVIKLLPGTYALTATETLADIGLTIEGESPQSTFITSSISGAEALYVNAASITLRNLTIRHTAAGTASGCIKVDANGLTLDNCLIEKTSGAPTVLGYGLWAAGGTGHRLTNGTNITCTSGNSKYGLYNDTATTTITVDGGEIQGDTFDIYGSQAGSTLTLNNVVLVNDLVSFTGTILGTHRGVAVYRSTTLSVSTLTVTVVLLDSEVRDDSGFHSTSSNTGRLTVPTAMAGWYLITGNVRFAGDSSGTFRQILIDVNASANYIAAQLSAPPGTAAFNMAIATLWYLAVGDYVQLYAHHNATGSLLLEVNSHSPSFRMVRVR